MAYGDEIEANEERFSINLNVVITPSMNEEIMQFVNQPRDKSRVVREMLQLGLAVYARGEKARQQALRGDRIE